MRTLAEGMVFLRLLVRAICLGIVGRRLCWVESLSSRGRGNYVLVGLAVTLVLFVVNLAVPHRVRLIGVALLLIPQIYLPGFFASLAVLWTLMTCFAGLTTRGRSRADSPLVVILGLFVAVTVVSLLWALPSGMHLGSVTVVFGIVFLLWLREVIVLARDEPRLLDTIMLWTVPGVVVQAVLAILFRLDPAVEDRFLHSNLALLAAGPRVEEIYTDIASNVIDPNRSGGFFMNGNVASLFGGVAALLLCVSARVTMRRWLYAVAALSFVGAIFTGSKTGAILGSGCAIAILLVPHLRRGKSLLILLPVALLMPFAFSQVMGLVDRVAPTFYAATGSSYSERELLWSRAAEMFKESPILGPGFGGWVEQVGKVGSRTDLPPHNFLVAAWAYSGIVAVALAIAFMVAAIVFSFRTTTAQPTLFDRRTATLALCAIAWVFMHGMGDNTALYGDRQTMILFALAFGYLYAMTPAQKQETPSILQQRKLGDYETIAR